MAQEHSGGGRVLLLREYIARLQGRASQGRASQGRASQGRASQGRASQGRAAESTKSSSATATAEPLEDIDTAHEELLVADEELRRQSEELERLRQEVAADLRRFRDLFDHAPDGYAETDVHGVVRVANRTLAMNLNIPVQFLERKPLINFVARGDCDRFRAALVRLAEGNTVRATSIRLRARHSGAPFFVDVHAAPIVSPARHVMGVRWALRTVASLDESSPVSIASASALARALIDQSSVAAAGKKLRLAVEIQDALRVEPELAARWFPILTAVLRAALATAEAGSEVPIAASAGDEAIVWQIGAARLVLPVQTG